MHYIQNMLYIKAPSNLNSYAISGHT
jgi:hypothetical protein